MISRRALELATAVLTGGFGVAVVVQPRQRHRLVERGRGLRHVSVSDRHISCSEASTIWCGALPATALANVPVAITSIELRRLAGLFVPAAIFVAAIPLLGMYVASALYVFAVLAIPRHQSVPRALAMAAATALALYVVFERMFQVSLPHGALPAAFGF